MQSCPLASGLCYFSTWSRARESGKTLRGQFFFFFMFIYSALVYSHTMIYRSKVFVLEIYLKIWFYIHILTFSHNTTALLIYSFRFSVFVPFKYWRLTPYLAEENSKDSIVAGNFCFSLHNIKLPKNLHFFGAKITSIL